jgi:hypothetical protein
MPPNGRRNPNGATRRKRVYVTRALERQIQDAARICGMSESKWMCAVIEAALDKAKALPKPRRRVGHPELPHLLNQLVMQVRKLGTNVNQLAHQANLGFVALTPKQIDYMLNQHQLVFSRAQAVLERAGG